MAAARETADVGCGFARVFARKIGEVELDVEPVLVQEKCQSGISRRMDKQSPALDIKQCRDLGKAQYVPGAVLARADGLRVPVIPHHADHPLLAVRSAGGLRPAA